MSDNIDRQFLGVRNIVRSALAWPDRLGRAAAFARANPDLFNNPAYWEQATSHDFGKALETVAGWARSAWDRMELCEGWEFALLSLGDSPSMFQLCGSGGQAATDEAGFRGLVLANSPVGCARLQRVAAPKWLWGESHNCIELFDDVLSPGYTESQWPNGSNGYFLWHLFASSALLAPLAEDAYRRRTLRGCQRLYVLSGFGESFVYMSTVTPDAIVYEGDEQLPPPHGR